MSATAKDIIIKPIFSKDAREFVKKNHYSGKVVNNSKLHFGVFLNGSCEGVLSFGTPMDKRRTIPLVKGTKWSEMLELNRMAFSDALPKNSESRAISICLKIIKKNYPFIKWILSFADGTQCGDGTIYRASGFVLTQIRKNSTILRLKDGSIIADLTVNTNKNLITREDKKKFLEGSSPLDGFQFRYVYFLHPQEINNLSCDVIPFSKIAEMGAGMYKGERKPHVKIKKALDGTGSVS